MNKLKRLLKNEDGSTIIWAFGIIMVMLVVLGGVLSFSKAYSVRSIKKNDTQQAYVTARSAVDLIVNALGNPAIKNAPSEGSYLPNASARDILKKFAVIAVGPQNDMHVPTPAVIDTSINFGSEMGVCDISITLTSDTTTTPNFDDDDPLLIGDTLTNHTAFNLEGTMTIVATVKNEVKDAVVTVKLKSIKEENLADAAGNKTKDLKHIQDHSDIDGDGNKEEIISRWVVVDYEEG